MKVDVIIKKSVLPLYGDLFRRSTATGGSSGSTAYEHRLQRRHATSHGLGRIRYRQAWQPYP